jgi:hypothetical protein
VRKVRKVSDPFLRKEEKKEYRDNAYIKDWIAKNPHLPHRRPKPSFQLKNGLSVWLRGRRKLPHFRGLRSPKEELALRAHFGQQTTRETSYSTDRHGMQVGVPSTHLPSPRRHFPGACIRRRFPLEEGSNFSEASPVFLVVVFFLVAGRLEPVETHKFDNPEACHRVAAFVNETRPGTHLGVCINLRQGI